jgi:hypothetical protein
MQHAMRMRHIVICGLSRSTIFFYITSQTALFSKKNLLNTKCMFWVSLQLLSETILILRRIELDSRHILEKSSNIKFLENKSSGSRVVACGMTEGRTDTHDGANSRYSQFCERA